MSRHQQWDWPLAWAAFLLHNGEELLFDLPDWAVDHPQFGWMAMVMTGQRFAWSVAVLSLIVTGLACVGSLWPRPWTELALKLFAVIMLLNAISHMLLSLLSASVMPGTISAVTLLLPLMLFILRVKQKGRP